MKLPGVPYVPRYTSDELVLGVVVAAALHVLAVGPFVAKAVWPSKATEEEKPLVARPVVQATLLKLGTPIDPKKLPDRVVPQQKTAPKKQITASKEDPPVKKKDAGAEPPPNTKDSDLTNLANKNDLFAEDAGKSRPEEGHAAGVDGGTETDPNKVHAGDAYFAQLGKFIADRHQLPSVITVGQARSLCAVFQVNINRNMIIWHVKQTPVQSSGNELFDDAARNTLLKLLDDKVALPQPSKEADELVRGRTLNLVILGDPHGDGKRCAGR